MFRIYFEITPCRKSLDSVVRLVHVYRTADPEDLTHKPGEGELVVHEKKENVKVKRSRFTTLRGSLGKLDMRLIKDLMYLGMTQEEAVNVLLICKREVSADYCDPTENEMPVKFKNDQVQITFDVKGRTTIPYGYVSKHACA